MQCAQGPKVHLAKTKDEDVLSTKLCYDASRHLGTVPREGWLVADPIRWSRSPMFMPFDDTPIRGDLIAIVVSRQTRCTFLSRLVPYKELEFFLSVLGLQLADSCVAHYAVGFWDSDSNLKSFLL